MRLLKVCLALMLGMGIIFVSTPKLYADDTSEAILKILIKKGVITQQEVEEMKAEIAKEKPKAPEGLEERVTKLEEETKKTPKLAHFLEGADMEISGYIQTRYTEYKKDSGTDGFSTSNAKLTLAGHVVPEIGYKLEIGPHKSPSLSILYDAYLTASYIPWMDVTMGQFKVPFSLEYITSSSKIKTADRAIFQGTITNEYGRGIKLDGDILNDYLYYAFAVIDGPDRSTAENNDNEDIMARLVLTPFRDLDQEFLQGLKIGGAIQHGRQPLNTSDNTEGDRTRYLGLVKYIYKGLDLQSEYVFQKQERTSGRSDLDRYGWYTLAAYKLPLICGKYKWDFEPHLKYEQYDPDKDTARDRQDMLTAGLTWYLNKYVYLMADYQWRDEQAETNNDRFILQSQVKF